MDPIGFTIWDWKEQPDWDTINKLLKRARFSGTSGVPVVKLISFDDIGDDNFYLVVADSTITKAQARRWLLRELEQ